MRGPQFACIFCFASFSFEVVSVDPFDCIRLRSANPDILALDLGKLNTMCKREKREMGLFGDLLPSIGSAAGVPVLFANFVGTTKSSDFRESCISAVPQAAFSDRSTIELFDALAEIFGISRLLAIEVSTHAQVLRLRRAVPSLANISMEHFAFPQHRQCRHSVWVISVLDRLPAHTTAVATPMTLPSSVESTLFGRSILSHVHYQHRTSRPAEHSVGTSAGSTLPMGYRSQNAKA